MSETPRRPLLSLQRLAEISGMVVALGTLIAAVLQYHSAEQWKRAEFASQQLERLAHDPELYIASKALDWERRRFALPQRYQEAYGGKVLEHSPEALAHALLPEEEQGAPTKEDVVYGDAFDAYFDFLERIDHYIDIGLFGIHEISALCYWVELVDRPKYITAERMHGYLERYGFDGVFSLIRRCRPIYDAPS